MRKNGASQKIYASEARAEVFGMMTDVLYLVPVCWRASFSSAAFNIVSYSMTSSAVGVKAYIKPSCGNTRRIPAVGLNVQFSLFSDTRLFFLFSLFGISKPVAPVAPFVTSKPSDVGTWVRISV